MSRPFRKLIGLTNTKCFLALSHGEREAKVLFKGKSQRGFLGETGFLVTDDGSLTTDMSMKQRWKNKGKIFKIRE